MVKHGPNIIAKSLIYIVLLIGIIIMIFPVVWMIITSLKTYQEALTYPPTIIPTEITFGAYTEILAIPEFLRSFINSSVYAVFGTFFAVFFASMSGFAFAKYNFRGKKLIFMLVLATMMIPGQITLIPVFLTVKNFGWYDTFFALIIPGLGNAFGIFLMRQFAQTIPNDFLHAARIDGAGEFYIYRRIFIPLCLPALTTLTVLDFMNRWNDLFWPLIVTSDKKMRTLQMIFTVISRKDVYDIIWNQLTASMVLSLIPILILYAAFQKYFTQGVVLTGLKG